MYFLLFLIAVCPIITVGTDGKLYNVMRYDMTRLNPCYGLAIRYLVNTKDPDAPIEFDRVVNFPANHSKFEIKFDEISQMYYSVATRITCPEDSMKRTLLSLMISEDMLNWTVATDIFDERKSDPEGKFIGFQYVDFLFDGDDIIFLCRTAMNHAASFHDNNCITFHRIKNFRRLSKRNI